MLVHPVSDRAFADLEKEVIYIKERAREPFALVAFPINNWMQELSPWPAPPAFGNESFGNGAPQTLRFVLDELLPAVVSGREACLIGGYSLAALFTLWATYQTDQFMGAACASPPLWMKGWEAYATGHRIQAQKVYLSLGDREDKTRNQLIARGGECLQRQAELLAPHTECRVERTSGGHFERQAERVAHAFLWLMDSC